MFGSRDYSLIWDGGQFDTSRSVHELLITVADGRQVTTQIIHGGVLEADSWIHVHDVGIAFENLNRRASISQVPGATADEQAPITTVMRTSRKYARNPTDLATHM